eukprot:2379061-Amphidinium_carterae.1
MADKRATTNGPTNETRDLLGNYHAETPELKAFGLDRMLSVDEPFFLCTRTWFAQSHDASTRVRPIFRTSNNAPQELSFMVHRLKQVKRMGAMKKSTLSALPDFSARPDPEVGSRALGKPMLGTTSLACANSSQSHAGWSSLALF